ncbi:MAG: Fic family protein [Bacteroides sp.]|nr:Fic family protein [Bacteroides sp.]
MDYMTVKEASEKWRISERMIRRYCDQERIEGAIHVGSFWIIPAEASVPNASQKEKAKLHPLANRIAYQRRKNNHFGIYEYIQVNLAYSSSRMASNRLTRQQVEEAYRTNKVATAFEPMKVDDIIEIINHFACMRYVVDSVTTPLTQSYIKKLHSILTYGTYSDRKRKIGSGEYRTQPSKFGVTPKEINRGLSELIKEYEKLPVDFERILNFHVRFERIHPFDDYNGRVGRVIMMKECLRFGIDPFIIDDKRRGAYNRGIAQWDESPETLRTVCLESQKRFQAKKELCRLMQYSRPAKE